MLRVYPSPLSTPRTPRLWELTSPPRGHAVAQWQKKDKCADLLTPGPPCFSTFLPHHCPPELCPVPVANCAHLQPRSSPLPRCGPCCCSLGTSFSLSANFQGTFGDLVQFSSRPPSPTSLGEGRPPPFLRRICSIYIYCCNLRMCLPMALECWEAAAMSD